MKSLFLEIRLTAFAVAFLLLVGWATAGRFGVFDNNKRPATEQSVVKLAEKLDAQVERGRYVRADPASIADKDSWGHPVKIEYRDEGVGERLRVVSAGADGSHGTDDDIVATRWLLNGKGLGERLHDGAAATASQVAQGMMDGVAFKFKKAFNHGPDGEDPSEQ